MTSESLITKLAILALAVASTANGATTVYDQPHNGTGTLYQSSWLVEDGSDYDILSWDNFTLPTAQAITEIHWRGGYIYNAQFGPLIDFTVRFYPSIAAGSEPAVAGPPLVEYTTVGNANQTLAGTFGGVTMYDYHFALPSAFQAAANTKYWIEIFANQPSIPDWAFAAGSGGNGAHYRFVEGMAMYQSVSGDLAFKLLTSDAPNYSIAATADPANAGTISGTGAYPSGTNATLVATPNNGFGFLNWTEGATIVSNNPAYTFAVNANHTFVAHFTPAYTITTTASPSFGGTATGGGIYDSGTSVTVDATPNAGFIFTDWTEFGATVSTSASYAFTASANRTLVANFDNDPLSITFNFDNAPSHTSLPISLTISGLTADLSATGSGFSIQPADTLGFTPAGFAGLCVYPNSVFAADLLVSYSQTLTSFSIMYSPQELGCDDSATMRVTAFMNGINVGTATTTAPSPGTWPTGALSITVPGGFNSVVVHYASKPPTCQDWGPIFLADNMVVTLAAPIQPCTGDITGNGVIDVDDLLEIINNWGNCPTCGADITANGVVDVDDLLEVINHWGMCP